MNLAGWTLAELLPLFAAGATAITALYLLRMRRRQLVVPFAALWRQVTRESDTRRLWRKLRRMLSWLLQLCLLALLCLALGDPRPSAWLRDPVTLAIVIDRSASMGGPAGDGTTGTADPANPGLTRLDLAVRRARAELSALGPVDRALVITAGPEVAVPGPLGRDSDPLLRSLEGLRPAAGEADLGRAIALARSALAGQPGGRILVLSDGALDPAGAAALAACTAPVPEDMSTGTGSQAVPKDSPADAGPQAVPEAMSPGTGPEAQPDRPPRCQLARVGGPVDNVAITAFAARRYPEDREHVEVLAEVHNLGDAAAEVVLEVRADGLSVGRRTLTLAPGERHTEVLRDLDAARTRLLAQLSPGPGSSAAALGPAGDDRAHAIVPPLRPFKVALITEGSDLFLEAALLTLQDHIQLTGMGPAAVPGNPALAEADLVVIDLGAEALPSPLPAQDLVIFDPLRRADGPSPFTSNGELTRPFLTEQALGHPLLDGVVLKDVNLARATRLAALPGDQVLIRSLGDPVALLRHEAGQDDGSSARTIVGFGFDPRQSDLPLRTAFPLLVANLVTYFEQARPGFVASVPVGAARPLAVAELGLAPEGLGAVEVAGPEPLADGTSPDLAADAPLPTARVPVDRGVFRLRAREPGIYRVTALDGPAAGATVLLAVNQASAPASDLHDRIDDLELPPEASAGDPPTPLPVGEGPLWTLLLLAAAALIALEWATYHRRVTV
ncbi:VWA domain-containing protein [Nannocystis sp.]|uniref:vWA domain-containing protein n=1 Tax=Nannocystis sp. TaxID=1962667 RepID=UPI0025F721A9|nr:VWA domain-containing protein [Nannocystis sp.]MBK7825872.1 VWA domain-containing protein [Nannocystis sp.]